MLRGGLKAAVCSTSSPSSIPPPARPAEATGQGRDGRDLSPFKANLAFSDVLLPIAPFTETSGTFVNAEGRVQSFHAVVKPLAEARPAWKVLRVLGNLLGPAGFRLRDERTGARRGAGARDVAAGSQRADAPATSAGVTGSSRR